MLQVRAGGLGENPAGKKRRRETEREMEATCGGSQAARDAMEGARCVVEGCWFLLRLGRARNVCLAFDRCGVCLKLGGLLYGCLQRETKQETTTWGPDVAP